jgi:hypothetical protein
LFGSTRISSKAIQIAYHLVPLSVPFGLVGELWLGPLPLNEDRDSSREDRTVDPCDALQHMPLT